jgi:hypothetical protein
VSPSGLNGDRTPPYSEDAEKGVLCSFVLSPREVADLCVRSLQPGAFHVPAHRIIYDLVIKSADRTKPVDFVWLKQTLKDRGLLEEIGGVEFLNHLFNFVPTSAGAPYYIGLVREKWAARTAITDYQTRIDAAYDANADPKIWDPDGGYIGVTIPRQLKGASFLDFSQRQIDESKTLLGNRYLCRGGGLFVVAPSGSGKSVLVAQAAILWALGRLAFGIRPSKPLRILIIQAEDDDGDIIEMSQIIEHLGLSDEERVLVDANTHIEFVNDATGDEFLDIVDGFITQWKPDILIINPYSAYLGAEIKDDAANTHFLRNRLNPILTRHGCAALIIHHTPKTNFRDTDKWKASDWMYSGAGAACLTNWARAYLVIDPCEEHGLYKFIAAKRGKRIGWGDAFPVFEQYWAWSRENEHLLWLPADQDQIALAKKAAQKTPEDLLSIIPKLDPISQEQLIEKAKPLGRDKVKAFANILIDEHKAFAWKLRRPGKKSGVGYAQRPEPE